MRISDWSSDVCSSDLRLRLTAPLAVQDMLALIRFALQPGDDLTLATLLVSPLIGLSQDQLLTLAHDRRGGLWRRLRQAAETDPAMKAAADWLLAGLAKADFAAPRSEEHTYELQ